MFDLDSTFVRLRFDRGKAYTADKLTLNFYTSSGIQPELFLFDYPIKILSG